MSNKTAIIIGAGPAGLTAAYKLLKETDIKPIILEESEYIGGISRTAVYKGNRMDLGGHRFFSKSAEVNELWRELIPLQGAPSYDDKVLGVEKELAKAGPDPETEDRVMLLRNRISRILFLHKFFDYPISLKFDTFKNMGLGRTAKAGAGYVKAAVFKKEEDSLENFYINRFGRPLYEMFFEDYTENLWGRHPSQISAEWGAQRVKGLSLFGAVWNVISKPFRSKDKVETSLIEQYLYPKKGPGQLWEFLTDDIKKLGGEIIMNTKVKDIKLSSDGKRIESVTSEDGRTFEGDIFMSTMPVKDLVMGMDGDVPSDVRRVAGGLPYRDYITVGVLVNKLKLENKTKIKTLTGNVPDCWIYVQEREVKLGRLQIFNNWSPYMVELCNEVGLGVNLDDSGVVAVLEDLNNAVCCNSGSHLGLSLQLTLLTKDLDCCIHIALCLNESLLALHHTDTGLCAERCNVFCGNRSHFRFLRIKNYSASAASVAASSATTVSPCLPSITASASAEEMSLIARIASSLPGIT